VSLGRASALAAIALVLAVECACACACTKSEENKPVHTYDLPVRPGPQPVGVSAAPVEAGEPVARGVPPAEETTDDRSPTETAALTAPATAASAAKPAPTTAPSAKANPDDAVLEKTRVACGRCFSSLPAQAGAADRSAHVSLTVVPTGTVSRADVSSGDTTEAFVLDCVQQAAESAVFSDNGNGPLRSYAIDVRVHASPASGGR
jgi:hypothetical protein